MIWIVVIVSVIAFILFLIKRFANKLKIVANPIDTLNYDGCLGFRIDDPADFVLSRIKHMGLEITNKNKNEIINLSKSNFTIYIADGFYNNIQTLMFFVSDYKMCGAFMKVKPEVDEYNISEIKDMLTNRLSKRLGKPCLENNERIVWSNNINVIEINPYNNHLNIALDKGGDGNWK